MNEITVNVGDDGVHAGTESVETGEIVAVRGKDNDNSVSSSSIIHIVQLLFLWKYFSW